MFYINLHVYLIKFVFLLGNSILHIQKFHCFIFCSLKFIFFLFHNFYSIELHVHVKQANNIYIGKNFTQVKLVAVPKIERSVSGPWWRILPVNSHTSTLKFNALRIFMCNTNAINMVGYIYSATILNSSIIKLTNGEINRITINRIMKGR